MKTTTGSSILWIISMMKSKIRILPYKQGSKSAKALADELGGKVLKLVGSTFKPKSTDVIINWGTTQSVCQTLPLLTAFDSYTLLNQWLKIADASNKLKFFEKMKEHCPDVIPRFWTNKDDIPDDAFPVVCRTVLSGHSGAGIVIADDRASLVGAPLYVQYVKKKDEYRVHLGKGREGQTVIIAIQRKARRNGFENPNWQIRNLDNGFVFVRDGVTPPASVSQAAQESFQGTGLDFGAVDVIYNENLGRAYVLEINTAPGLEGQTIKDYADFFRGAAGVL